MKFLFSNTTITTMIVSMFLVLFYPAVDAMAKNLSGAEIKAVIASKTFSFKGKSRGTISYTSSTFKGSDKKWGKFTGTWNVEGNKYCYKNSYGNSKCVSVKDKGNGAFRLDGRTYTPQ